MTEPGLARLQTAFQERLLTGSDGLTGHLVGGGPFLKVYDYAYTTRLIEVLAEDFPGLHTLLGDERFLEAAKGYLADHPSRARSIRWVGDRLSRWLERTPPWNTHAELADMARFEWALGLAFDAPDAPHLKPDALVAVAPETWPLLTFDLHPSLTTVTLSWNIVPFQQAVAAEREPDAAPARLEKPATWAVWRDPESFGVHFRELASDEAASLADLASGVDFADICERLAGTAEGDEAAVRAAGLLRSWMAAGWVSGLGAEGAVSIARPPAG